MSLRLCFLFAASSARIISASLSASRPNIIFILSDDLGYGDSSYTKPHKGTQIATPQLERMAREGLTFLTGYSGPICAPSRTTLMTGRHMGHTTIRGNDGTYSPLKSDDITVAAVLKSAGYHTALMGKWGLGDAGTDGYPLAQGFDEFIGQSSQVDCHNWYPSFIQNNSDYKVEVAENAKASIKSCGKDLVNCKWANDLFLDWSIDYIRRRAQGPRPFFLYASFTTPHEGSLAGTKDKRPVPAPYVGKYEDQSKWSTAEQHFASSIWAQDVFVGRILDELDSLKISDNTIVFFSGDNGPEDGHLNFDDGNGPFRGCKASLHEGGVRQQILVRWPNHIQEGSTSDHWFTFWDFLPTAADLANATLPVNVDGKTAVPSLEGKAQDNLTPVYYEFCWYGYGLEAINTMTTSHQDNPTQTGKPSTCSIQNWGYGSGWAQSYRQNNWKAIRVHEDNNNMVLYDLSKDEGEQHDVAKQHPDVVQDLAKLMDASHTDSAAWPKGTASKKCCGNCFTKGGCGGACSGHAQAIVV